MFLDYASVFVFIVFALGFVLLNLLISKILSPKVKSLVKDIPYECGEKPVGTPWIRFNPRYYVYAVVFLIFDVEVAFMFPCVVVYKNWVETQRGHIAFTEIFLFVFILVLGFAYVWRNGLLTWHKELDLPNEEKNHA